MHRRFWLSQFILVSFFCAPVAYGQTTVWLSDNATFSDLDLTTAAPPGTASRDKLQRQRSGIRRESNHGQRSRSGGTSLAVDPSNPLNIVGISFRIERSSAPADKVFELLGDYNSNGTVDAADDVLWLDAVVSEGDDDGVVNDQDDRNIWMQEFGNSLAIDNVDAS